MASRRFLICSSLVVGLAVPGLVACGGSEDRAASTTLSPSITGLLTADPTLSVASQLLATTGRGALLASGAPYTLLVPTNDALDVYAKAAGLADAEALVASVESDPDGKGAFVANLFVEGTVTGADFPKNAGETFQTIGGLDVTIGVENGLVTLATANTKATVTAVNVVTGNVTVHVIDTVLS